MFTMINHTVYFLILFIVFFSSIASATGASVGVAHKSDTSNNQLLVKFKPSVRAIQRNSIRNNINAKIRINRANNLLKANNLERWVLPSNTNIVATIAALKASRLVEFVEPNYSRPIRLMPNDPQLGQQWAIQNTGQNIADPIANVIGIAGSDLSLPLAWNMTTGSRNVVVAIIDDSVDITHADIAANIWTNPNEIAANGIDDDGNGYIDDVHGWDFKNNDNDTSADLGMGEGHGIAVAGCIGAIGNNGIGVSGINWQVSIMPLKFSGDVFTEVEAINYALANGADIVNFSAGSSFFSRAEEIAIQNLQAAGILFVTAAGNEDGNNDLVADYPSGLNIANIIAVASSDSKDALTSWSHFGQTTVDIAAPGVSIFTTLSPLTSGSVSKSGLNGLQYGYLDGTSFSSPYVAGIAALIKAQFPNSNAQTMKGRILASADPIIGAQALLTTDGRANAFRALTITPQPNITIQKIQVIDSLAIGSNNNGELDSGEQVELNIVLENSWLTASNIRATLRSANPNIRIINNSSNYNSIVSGASGTSLQTFQIAMANINKHQRVLFALDISANGAYAGTRNFSLEVGTLTDGISSNNIIQQNVYDEFHLFHIDVPKNTSQLKITTTSLDDIDILVRKDTPPAFSFFNYWLTGGVDAQTYKSVIPKSGNEQVLINMPTAGTYYVQVINFMQIANVQYTITASTNNMQQASINNQPQSMFPMTGGGGGCVGLLWEQILWGIPLLGWMFIILLFKLPSSSDKYIRT
ncbi:MAG: S8 family peptidase [Mariprofundales bacterium]